MSTAISPSTSQQPSSSQQVPIKKTQTETITQTWPLTDGQLQLKYDIEQIPEAQRTQKQKDNLRSLKEWQKKIPNKTPKFQVMGAGIIGTLLAFAAGKTIEAVANS